jgi:signal transduction histidine kinase
VLGGVCAGLAAHLNRPVGRIRVIAIALALCGGGGVLLYLWLWAFTPLVPASEEESGVRRSTPVAAILFAFAAVGVLTALGVEAGLRDVPNPALPATTVFAAVAVVWSLVFDRRDPGRSTQYGLVVRSLSGALLILAGALLLTITAIRATPSAATAFWAVIMMLLGLVVFVAPQVLKLWRERMSERTAHIRETQRAEIAAHLHDSVLQTLALIQNRAGASSEVARLARAQERELRDWLFAGTTPSGNDLASELRDAAAAIELDYPARLEVVVVGESAEAANPALLAAAREAMVNAARHAGGEVSVYLELSEGVADVFVRDRGPGFDIDALPADRLGVRESIVGRMTRVGGTATVRPGVGGTGTEIHLHLETEGTRG